MKEDGILSFVEKFKHSDVEEYQRRELQKYHSFKTRYFSREAVVAKGKEVLTSMNLNEVMLDDMAQAIRAYFRHCYVTWNSGNFYTLVASNSLPNLKSFMTCLGEPAIPNEFVYGTVPRSLFDEHDLRTVSSSQVPQDSYARFLATDIERHTPATGQYKSVEALYQGFLYTRLYLSLYNSKPQILESWQQPHRTHASLQM